MKSINTNKDVVCEHIKGFNIMTFLLVTTISTWLGGRCIDKISQEYKTLGENSIVLNGRIYNS